MRIDLVLLLVSAAIRAFWLESGRLCEPSAWHPIFSRSAHDVDSCTHRDASSNPVLAARSSGIGKSTVTTRRFPSNGDQRNHHCFL